MPERQEATMTTADHTPPPSPPDSLTRRPEAAVHAADQADKPARRPSSTSSR